MTQYIGHSLVGRIFNWAMIIPTLILFAGCSNRSHNNRQAPLDSNAKSVGYADSILHEEIFSSNSQDYCFCATSREVDYYFAHIDEFPSCTALGIHNELVDCDLFRRILSLEKVVKVNITNFGCDKIPEEILQARHLRSLSIRLPLSWKRIPSIIFQIPNLTDLGFGGDGLTEFEGEIPVNTKLKDIDFYYSPIEEVPMEFAKFPNLKYLNIGTPEHPIKNVKEFRELRPDISFSSNEFD